MNLNQGEMAFNPLKFFGGEPVKQRDMIDEGTLEEDQIDTGLGVGDAILRRRLEQKTNDGAIRALIMDNDFPAVMANGGEFLQGYTKKRD